MLKEVKGGGRANEERNRRWFSDDYFDLVIWYDDRSEIEGFQLCYDIGGNERALTWRASGEYAHDSIDDGETPFRMKQTPILVEDGIFEWERIAEDFRQRSAEIDQAIAAFVLNKMMRYGSGRGKHERDMH
jgi:hypothetical protein